MHSRRSALMLCTPARSSAPAGSLAVETTPSVGGHFDRISRQIDEVFGTELEFRRLCQMAAAHGGTVIDDIVPGHTGKGADFRLAEMKVGDYPGIYHMVEMHPRTGTCCPGCLPVRIRSTSTARLNTGWTGPVTSSAGCNASSSTTRGSRTPTGARPHRSPARMGSSDDGCTCTTSRTVSPRSTGWIPRSPACGWSSATRCTRWVISAPERSDWTPTASSVWRRAPRMVPRLGRRDTHCRRRSTS